MTDDQKAFWQAYVDQLRPLLRLTDWTVTIVDKPEDADDIHDGVGAAISAAERRKDADLVLGERWDEFTNEQRREYITHELVHLHMWHLMRYAESLFANNLAGMAKAMADDQINFYLEMAVDELARAIAPYLPLPWPPLGEWTVEPKSEVAA